ncbi:MAG TPA: riboflavin synthase [Cytophagales bacterium]|nr:riboflavin synthase [Cytophagales bacterium]
MFTGIVEDLGKVISISANKENKDFLIEAPFVSDLKIDQSIAHNGVCLTVTEIAGDKYKVTAIKETLNKTNLNYLKPGDVVNLERCLSVNSRFDGHIVQGHIDQTGICKYIQEESGSWKFGFEYDFNLQNITVEKGSICVNGVSLTVVDSGKADFSVAIIPYTYEHTNFNKIAVGDYVNLEFDIIGKYLKKMYSLMKA